MKKDPSDDSGKPYQTRRGDANKAPADAPSRPISFYERLAQNAHDLSGDLNNQIVGAVTHQDLAEKFSRPINEGLARQYMAGKLIIEKMIASGKKNDDFSGLSSDQIASVQAYQKVHSELPAKLPFVDRDALIRSVENNIQVKAGVSYPLTKSEARPLIEQARSSAASQDAIHSGQGGKTLDKLSQYSKDIANKPGQAAAKVTEKEATSPRDLKKEMPPAAVAADKPNKSYIGAEMSKSSSAPPKPHMPEEPVLRSKDQSDLLAEAPTRTVPPPHPVEISRSGEKHTAEISETRHTKEDLGLDSRLRDISQYRNSAHRDESIHGAELARKREEGHISNLARNSDFAKGEHAVSLFSPMLSQRKSTPEWLMPRYQTFVGRQVGGSPVAAAPIAQVRDAKSNSATTSDRPISHLLSSSSSSSSAVSSTSLGQSRLHEQSMSVTSGGQRWKEIVSRIHALVENRGSRAEALLTASTVAQPFARAQETDKTSLASDRLPGAVLAARLTMRAEDQLIQAQSKAFQLMTATKSIPLGRQFEAPEYHLPLNKSESVRTVNTIAFSARPFDKNSKNPVINELPEGTESAQVGGKCAGERANKDANAVSKSFVVRGFMPDKRYITGGELAFVAVMALASASRVRSGVSVEQALMQNNRQYVMVESESRKSPDTVLPGKSSSGKQLAGESNNISRNEPHKQQHDENHAEEQRPRARKPQGSHSEQNAQASISISDSVSDSSPPSKKNSQDKKIFLRPQIIVQEGDNLCEIAETLFNDGRLGHLIADLNSSVIDDDDGKAARIIRLKTRQRLTLPVYQDVIDYDRRLKDLKKWPLITVVETSAIDSELYNEGFENLSRLIGIDSPNKDPLDQNGKA